MTPEEEKALDEKFPTMGKIFADWKNPLVQKWFNEQDEKTQKMTLSMKKINDTLDRMKKRHE